MPPLCPVWHDSWGFDFCAKNPKTFEDWDRTYVGWEYRVCKYLPRKEAALLLYEAIKSPDGKREIRQLSMREDIMTPTGLNTIHTKLKTAFGEKKVSNITGAMERYEAIRRHPDEGVKAFAARFIDAERIMIESDLKPYEGEARGNKFLVASKLLPADVRNVFIYSGGK